MNGSWLSGYDVKTNKELSEIKVYADNNVLQRKYVLNYTQNANSSKRMIASVTQYGSDGVTALPAVKFTYSQWKEAFAPRNPGYYPTQLLSSGDVHLMDMHGDGLVDIVSKNTVTGVGLYVHDNITNPQQKGQVSFSEQHGITNSEKVPINDAQNLRYVDFNGDGLVDVLYGSGQWKVWLNRGDGGFYPEKQFSRSPTVSISTANYIQLVDMNGDGWMDIVETRDNDYKFYFNIDGSNIGTMIQANNPPQWSTAHGDVRMVDFNGDGAADVIYGGSNGRDGL